MDLADLIATTTAVFFALLGIWAALDRRHWFLRFAVVAAVVAAPLLIPAYELTLQFGLAVLLINAGIWLANLRSSWPPRLSLQSALLAMVVVAIVSLFVAAMPEWEAGQWADCISVGVCTAWTALACVALVYGRSTLPWRLSHFALLLLAAAASFVSIDVAGAAMAYYRRVPWQDAFGYALEQVPPRSLFRSQVRHHGLETSLGIAVSLAALVLARESRWFHNHEATASPRRRLAASRVSVAALALLISCPLLSLYFRLLNPPPLQHAPIPEDNGYDDLVAAGRMKSQDELNEILQRSFGPTSPAPISTEESELLNRICKRINEGLSKEIVFPHAKPNAPEHRNLEAASFAMWIQAERGFESGGFLKGKDGCRSWLDFAQRTRLLDDYRGLFRLSAEAETVYKCRDLLAELSASECLAAKQILLDYVAQLPPMSLLKDNEARWDSHRSWQKHLRIILADWSGRHCYESLEGHVHQSSVRVLLGASRLAIQAYYRDHGEVPADLEELVPDYLDEIPCDPWGNGTLRSIKNRRSLTVYSVGYDGVDQTCPVNGSNTPSNDMTARAPRYKLTECVRFMIADRLEPLARTLQQILVESGHLIRDNAARLQQAHAP